MNTDLRVLIVEDSESDAELIIRQLTKEGRKVSHERVDTAVQMKASLQKQPWDLVIADYRLPQFSAPAALKVLHESGLDIPFIVVSGTIGEDTAVELMRSGAHDYIMKDKLGRLAPAVKRELADAGVRRERKNAQDSLMQSEARYRRIVNTATEGIWMMDEDYTTTFVNKHMTEMLGYTEEEMLGKRFDSFMFKEDLYDHTEKMGARRQGEPGKYERRFKRKDGSTLWTIISSSTLVDEQGTFKGSFGMFTDITDRKQAEENLLKAAAQWRTTFDSIADPIMIIDNDFRIVRANRATASLTGLPIEKVTGNSCYSVMHHADSPPEICPHAKMLETKEHSESEIHLANTGKWFFITVDPMFDDTGNLIGTVHAMKDMTERRIMEERIRKSEENYRSIFNNSIEGIFQTTPEGKFISVNPAQAKIFGYGSPQELMEQIKDIGKQHYVNPEDRETYKNTLDKEGIVKGFEVELIKKDGNRIWGSLNARAAKDDGGAVIYYEGTLEDITARKHAEYALRESMAQLNNALQGTVQAIATAVEVRDPYTSGHQKRVSAIAVAIASAMGLPETQIEGIRIAAIIHDIGKISIPAEILGKPSKLTDIEFSLVKMHSETGYDIIKDIYFPWPIAQIILQHHEKLDGSGYPQGLKDGAILLEAQILSVADVVEAMASHRPYRAGLGINTALEEIEKNRGILYHQDAADACLRLFREKGFKFEL